MCQGIYNLYSSTVFQQKQLRPAQAVLLLRGVCKGESSAQIAREIGLSRPTVLSIRRKIPANTQAIVPQTPIADDQTETDEMFPNAGEKKRGASQSLRPTPAQSQQAQRAWHLCNDRPPIAGTIGRASGQVRLRVVHHTDRETLEAHVHKFTEVSVHVYTDEWRSYNHILRAHATVCHSQREWARDDDGDGIREVHTNTAECLWTTVRTFLRPLRGVHKKYLAGYIAMCEFSINLKRISCDFISQLVTCTNS